MINPNLVIDAGTTIRSVTTSKTLLASAEVADPFPYKFGIYDLPQFLNAVDMFDDPELVFDDGQKFVEVKSEGQSLRYYFTAPSMLVSSDKTPNMPDCEINFTLTNKQLASIKKASSTLGANDFILKNEDGVVTGTVADIKNPTSNRFVIGLGDLSVSTDEPFELVFDIPTLKFVDSDVYQFSVSSKLISSIKTPTIQYWMALKKSSKYGV